MIFRFGSYALDAERRELTRSGKRAALERQVFDILLYFLENRHRVVTRDDVLRAVWRGRLVSESTLSSRITAVRQAIGDSGARQRLIRTVTRGGYRFVGAVTVSRPPGRPVSASDITVSAGDKPSVLIVPFANLSGDAGQDVVGKFPRHEDALSRHDPGIGRGALGHLPFAVDLPGLVGPLLHRALLAEHIGQQCQRFYIAALPADVGNADHGDAVLQDAGRQGSETFGRRHEAGSRVD